MGLVHVQAHLHSSVRSVLWLFWKYSRQHRNNAVSDAIHSAVLFLACVWTKHTL